MLKSYDPVTRRIYITPEAGTEIPAGFENVWQARPPADVATFFDGAPGSLYVYVRVWDRGDDTTSPPRIPIVAPFNLLGHTGVRVVFNAGPLRNNDFWIIAARPDTPDVLVPWILKSQAPPIGVKRYRAPLGLIRETRGVVTGTARRRVRSATDQSWLLHPSPATQCRASAVHADSRRSMLAARGRDDSRPRRLPA